MRPMSRAKAKRAEKPDQAAGNGVGHDAVTGAEFLVSILETHHTRRNGNIITMESGLKAQQELSKIEEQITRLQALEGQNAETVRQIQQLHDRVNDLRRRVAAG